MAAMLVALSLTACGRGIDCVPALVVSAASSLTTVLEPLAATFERDTGIRVELNLAASSTLAAQVLAGAPVDVFISADLAQMDRVAAEGLVRPATRTDLLSNQLVVVAPLDPPVSPAASPAVLDSFARIAIGDPAAVPAGDYARAYLQSVGWWDRLQDRLIPTRSVRAALMIVEAGEVDAGIVYRSDALSSHQVTQVFAVSIAEGPDIVYPAAVTTGSANPAAGERWLVYLAGPAASAVFEAAGFIVPRERR
jgi:molybdate transport system substrate-binding protein